MPKAPLPALFALVLSAGACAALEPLAESTTQVLEVETLILHGRLWEPLMPEAADGVPITIEGTLTIPATDKPVPAVIITHGCGGIGGAERGWARDLNELGYATLLLDSFGGRGISSICLGRETVSVASLLYDVYRAVDVLSEVPYVDESRIATMGLSFGGRTSLWSAMTRFQERYEGRPLQGHIAFYPSTCFIELEGEHLVSGPIRIFHGTADDWTPIDQCISYVERLKTHDVDAKIYGYVGALHSFDDITLGAADSVHLPAPSPRNCSFVEVAGRIIDTDTGTPAGVASSCVEVGVTYGFHRGARERAAADLEAFLEEIFHIAPARP